MTQITVVGTDLLAVFAVTAMPETGGTIGLLLALIVPFLMFR